MARSTQRIESEQVPPAGAPGQVPDVVPDKPLVPPEQYRVRRSGPSPVDDDAPVVRYPFLFDSWMRPISRLFGVTEQSAAVRVDSAEIEVTFGRWRLRTERANIAGVEITGPYRPWKVAGPPHLSLADRGITFATNSRRGVCIRFHRPVPGIDPLGVVRHPAMTVTISQPEHLADMLVEEAATA